MNSFEFTPDDRIRNTREFEQIYALGNKHGDRYLLIFAAPNTLGRTRIGLSVSRKHGPAVIRNQIKRRLREVFRTSKSQLPVGWDLILIPRNSTEAKVPDYARSLRKLTRRLVEPK